MYGRGRNSEPAPTHGDLFRPRWCPLGSLLRVRGTHPHSARRRNGGPNNNLLVANRSADPASRVGSLESRRSELSVGPPRLAHPKHRPAGSRTAYHHSGSAEMGAGRSTNAPEQLIPAGPGGVRTVRQGRGHTVQRHVRRTSASPLVASMERAELQPLPRSPTGERPADLAGVVPADVE